MSDFKLIPEIRVHQICSAFAQKTRHRVVQKFDSAVRVDHRNTIARGFNNSAISGFACCQRKIGLTSFQFSGRTYCKYLKHRTTQVGALNRFAVNNGKHTGHPVVVFRHLRGNKAFGAECSNQAGIGEILCKLAGHHLAALREQKFKR